MNYFTKWLPVEGGIKDGDWFKWQDEGTDSPYLFKCTGLTENTHLQVKWAREYGAYSNGIDRGETNESGYGDWAKCFAKKVKLFLCGRNIQDGDTIYSELDKQYHKVEYGVESGYSTFIPSGYWACDRYDAGSSVGKMVVSIPKYNSYKVIGEISPDALSYVKADEEYTEKDIRVAWWADLEAYRGFGSFEGMEISDSYKEFMEHGYVEANKDKVYSQIQILGPCGKFH